MGNLEFPLCNILLKYSLDSCIYISQTNFLIFLLAVMNPLGSKLVTFLNNSGMSSHISASA